MTDIDYDALAMLYGCTHKFEYTEHKRLCHEAFYYGMAPSEYFQYESVCNAMSGRFAIETRLHTRDIGTITPLE